MYNRSASEEAATAVSLLKLPHGGFGSETAETLAWIQKWLKKSVGVSII
jgi:hypothetical protein